MPRGDRTGPMGLGSGTGRNMGYCSGADAPGFASAPGRGGFGRGFARGGGFGRGGGMRGAWRRGPAAFATPGQPVQGQEQPTQAILDALEAINARLSKLENAAGQD